MKAEPPRAADAPLVVIDTNVWISAALTREGVAARLVRQVLLLGRPVFSPATFAELETRIWRPRFDPYLSLELRQRILHDLDATAHWVEITPDMAARTWCRDPDDDMFIQAALTAGATWLVTGDQDLLDVPDIPGLRILTPAGALRLPGFS
ncbi:MAG: putative toxin-antitoxin system toxin component, PIN family [Xanthomonadaceae bacterium]|nr:putative toxin-antitoxin system toxin component, PIN family [Xanthomonadaceae bacterium]